MKLHGGGGGGGGSNTRQASRKGERDRENLHLTLPRANGDRRHGGGGGGCLCVGQQNQEGRRQCLPGLYKLVQNRLAWKQVITIART